MTSQDKEPISLVEYLKGITLDEIAVITCLLVVGIVVPVLLSYKLANKYGLVPIPWAVLAVVFTWAIPIVLFLIPRTRSRR